MDSSTTTTTLDPNRIINHAIASGLRADAPWLIVLGAAFVLLIAVLVLTGVRRRRRARLRP
jgi:LPXTG-motif cell wall-anchored protein